MTPDAVSEREKVGKPKLYWGPSIMKLGPLSEIEVGISISLKSPRENT
jgi:hypothetical protein